MIPGTLALAKALSANAKLGDCATTYAAQSSCPSDCVFFDGGGCYAETGQVGKFVTGPLNAAAAEREHDGFDVAVAEAAAIDALEVVPGRPLRLHTVGDCASNLAALVVAAAAKRYMDAGGGPAWAYTHAWSRVDREAWGTVSVLASCETGEDVRLARQRGYATALVVEEHPSEKLYEAEIGPRKIHESIPSTKVLPCPSQTRGVPCSDCRLCFDDRGILERGYSIGFELHGVPFAVSRARLALLDPNNPFRRKTTRELIPAYLEEHPEATDREMAIAFGVTASSVTQMRHKLERAA